MTCIASWFFRQRIDSISVGKWLRERGRRAVHQATARDLLDHSANPLEPNTSRRGRREDGDIEPTIGAQAEQLVQPLPNLDAQQPGLSVPLACLAVEDLSQMLDLPRVPLDHPNSRLRVERPQFRKRLVQLVERKPKLLAHSGQGPPLNQRRTDCVIAFVGKKLAHRSDSYASRSRRA